MSDLREIFVSRVAPLLPLVCDVRDDTALHAGHAGNNGGGHLQARIVSDQFAGKSTVARHRMVYSLVNDLMPHRIHALSLETLTPDEALAKPDRANSLR